MRTRGARAPDRGRGTWLCRPHPPDSVRGQPYCTLWDPPAVTAARRDREKDGRLLVGEFIALREQRPRTVTRIEDHHLDRAGMHLEVGPLTVRDLLHEWPHHDREHIIQLLNITRAAIWPAMGNARRFTRPEQD